MNLKDHFITPIAQFKEGEVFAFEQKIRENNIKSATLYITALGVFSVYIDEKKVSNEILSPGYTYYPRNLHIRKYDIGNMISDNSTLKVYLGQGWYCGRFTFENKVQIYGDMPKISWQLIIESDNGIVSYNSDDENVVSVPSPYLYAGLYDGEIYDAKNINLAPTYNIQKYTGQLPDVLEENNMCIRIREEMPVKEVIEHGDYTIIDFGQNFAGIISINPEKMSNEKLTLRHGEILNSDGSLYTTNLRKAKQQIVYIKGDDTSIYTPQFTYMGFRYVELRGTPYVDGLLKAHAVYSDMERTGFFICENPLVQKLYENQVWGQKSNYIEVPTDCPQRDERMGYTGDGQVFCETGAFNFDTRLFWKKFLKDIRYSQMDSKCGYVTPTVPATPGRCDPGFMSMLGWGNCNIIVPFKLYMQFGDLSFIEEQYDSMKAFADCEISKMGGLLGKKDLWVGPSLGDWLALGKDVAYMAIHNGPVSNAFVVNDMKLMTEAAKLLNKKDDETKYTLQYEKSKQAYIKAYIGKNKKMKDDYQGAYVMALMYVLDKGELYDSLYSTLVKKIKEEGMQTGFFATEHILPLLCDNGDKELAFDLLLSEKCPGWMYQIKHGATTTWERWDAIKEDGMVNESKMSSDNMVSFNHYSFGSVGKFYYKYILGILPLKPGYAKIQIKPHYDKRIGSYKGKFITNNGAVTVEYDQLLNEISIDTCQDSIIIIDNNTYSVSKGKYKYQVK